MLRLEALARFGQEQMAAFGLEPMTAVIDRYPWRSTISMRVHPGFAFILAIKSRHIAGQPVKPRHPDGRTLEELTARGGTLKQYLN